VTSANTRTVFFLVMSLARAEEALRTSAPKTFAGSRRAMDYAGAKTSTGQNSWAFSRVFAGENNVMELWKASSRAEEVLVLA
jgi:hypothetical protein